MAFPVVTSLFVCLQLCIYNARHVLFLKPENFCIGVMKICETRELSRLFLASFVHLDEGHIFFNTLLFTIYGQAIEGKIGSTKFLCRLLILVITSNAILAILLSIMDTVDRDYAKQCIVGASGVILSLKVLASRYWPFISIFSVKIDTFWCMWTEILFVHVIDPNSSFLGHLAGILAGMLLVKMNIDA
ncbi:rhomboid-like protein 14, mitochondrial [Centruroides sculpturatus]|uniref:rhomboid-like protein 14, mitochondrial n=1 Tax=Centruroides sculpturatus TaxID=218467 RepID=UPI000C6DE6CD|nr:rhomboid-like protein 14, mitochondrial [Centruroides sculpturatus]